jgi:hypothetical protein
VRLRSAAAAALIAVLGGCYSYGPHRGGELPQATKVRVHLSSTVDVRLPEVTANNVALLEGEIVRADSAELVISASMVWSNSGYEQLGQGATVAIPVSKIGSIEARRFDVLRTAGLAGLVVGGTAATFAANTGGGVRGGGGGGGSEQ